MGYRSKVILAVDADQIVMAKMADPTITEALNSADDVTPGYWSNVAHEEDDYEIIPGLYLAPRIPNFYVYTWDHTKWYNSFTDVAALEAWMEEMDDIGDEAPYQFMRDGEELGDVEQRGSWNYDIWHGIGYG